MERVLKELHWKTCLVYLDDIIVMGRIFNEHLKNLADVLERISMAGLKLNVKKCAFFQKQVKYLGNLLTTDDISTDEDKIRAVKDWRRPQNLYELRSFWGYAHITDALCLTLPAWRSACMNSPRNQRCINEVSHKKMCSRH